MKSEKKAKKPWLRLYLYVVGLITLTIVGATAVSGLLSWLLSLWLTLPEQLPEVLLVILFCDILGIIATILISHSIIAPATRLNQAVRAVAQGDFSIRLNERSRIREIQEMYDNFNVMAAELGATEMLQSDFVSNVSHEFKTPINAIEGYTMLLQEDCGLNQEQREYAEKILFNTNRLSGLVKNILLLSKLDNQNIPGRQERFRLDEQIRQAVVYLEPKWSPKNLEFDAELEAVSFLGNEQLLMHIWLNLIDNAIKFSPVDGRLDIRLRASEQNILVSVRDWGPGIPEPERKRIFDKFYQADSSHKDEGNGLGLALVKQVVTLHQGTVEAENCPEGGCKFTVVLPILPPRNPDQSDPG